MTFKLPLGYGNEERDAQLKDMRDMIDKVFFLVRFLAAVVLFDTRRPGVIRLSPYGFSCGGWTGGREKAHQNLTW